MKLAVAREELASALSSVQPIVGGRLSTLPILGNLLLTVKDGRMRITATNLDITVQVETAAQVEEEGEVTVPARTLAAVVRELSGPEVRLSSEQRTTTVLECGGSLFRLRGLPPEEFPPIEIPTPEFQLNVPQEQLGVLLQRTAFAASTDESRYILNGVLFEIRANELRLVATDGRRLALNRYPIEGWGGPEVEFVVPSRAIRELDRLLGREGSVEIGGSAGKILFRLRSTERPSVTMLTKAIEGSFPNYEQVIPKELRGRVVLVRTEFLQALRRAQLVTTERSSSVRLQLTAYEMAITASSPDIGEAKERLAVQYEGQEIALAFNPVFLIEPLRALDSESVTLELNDEFTPAVLRCDEPFLYIVMPMRSA